MMTDKNIDRIIADIYYLSNTIQHYKYPGYYIDQFLELPSHIDYMRSINLVSSRDYERLIQCYESEYHICEKIICDNRKYRGDTMTIDYTNEITKRDSENIHAQRYKIYR